MSQSKYAKLDANESIFFEKELEAVKSRSFDIKYPELKARQLIPVSTEAGAGAESIKYEQYEQVGMAKIIRDYSCDLMSADIVAREYISPIRSLGACYRYSVQEVRAAQLAGKPLQQRKADSARRAVMQKENNIAFFGDADNGLNGLLSEPNIPVVTLPADGATSQTTFADKIGTPDLIIRDLNNIANSIVDVSKGVETPDTLLLPVSQYTLLSSTPRSSTSDTTILQYFLSNNPFISNVEWVNELKGAGAGGTDVALAYRRSPDALSLEVPQDFETFPPQDKCLSFEVPVHMRTGGVIVYYPLSLAKAEGV